MMGHTVDYGGTQNGKLDKDSMSVSVDIGPHLVECKGVKLCKCSCPVNNKTIQGKHWDKCTLLHTFTMVVRYNTSD